MSRSQTAYRVPWVEQRNPPFYLVRVLVGVRTSLQPTTQAYFRRDLLINRNTDHFIKMISIELFNPFLIETN
jgi:hypothetical protein